MPVAQPIRCTKAELRRLRTVCELLGTLSRGLTVDEICTAGLSAAIETSSAKGGAILLFDPTGVNVAAAQGLSHTQKLAEANRIRAARTDEAAQLIFRDGSLQDERTAAHRDFLHEERLATVGLVPVIAEGASIGEFALCYADVHDAIDAELELAGTIAAQVAWNIERIRNPNASKQADVAAAHVNGAHFSTKNAFHDAGQYLAAIVEGSDDAIIGKDLNGIITSWNKSAERIFGYTAAEAIGNPVSLLAAPGLNEMSDILSKIRQGRRVEHYETRRRRKDGEVIEVALTVSPIRSAEGTIVGASKIARDITERRRSEQERVRLLGQAQRAHLEIMRSNEGLRRANRDLETFAYSASHDLREPLRNITLSAQLLQRSCRGRLQPHDAMFLANIVSSIERMNVLIDDLLAYTGATKYEASPQIVNSAQVLADVLEMLRGLISETGAVITSGELPSVTMHQGRLSQVFQNLISNAIKYRSKEAPRVHLSATQRDGWCTFCVVDNGLGIKPEYSQQIFGLFKRLHGREEYPGSGIGLAICQRIVEQYGGRIWVEQSTPGRGSTFCFTVPSDPEP